MYFFHMYVCDKDMCVLVYLQVWYSYKCTGMCVFMCACTYGDLRLMPCVFMAHSLYWSIVFHWNCSWSCWLIWWTHLSRDSLLPPWAEMTGVQPCLFGFYVDSVESDLRPPHCCSKRLSLATSSWPGNRHYFTAPHLPMYFPIRQCSFFFF